MQFLYRAPVGLAQVTLDGTVELMNPMSAQLLMPVTATGSLSNLFETLRDRVPHLRATVEAFEPGHGVICESQRFALEEGPDDSPRVLSISVMKIDASRLMVVLDDATAEVAREQEANRRSLRDAARIDPLTQIPNRLGMVERPAGRLVGKRRRRVPCCGPADRLPSTEGDRRSIRQPEPRSIARRHGASPVRHPARERLCGLRRRSRAHGGAGER